MTRDLLRGAAFKRRARPPCVARLLAAGGPEAAALGDMPAAGARGGLQPQ